MKATIKCETSFRDIPILKIRALNGVFELSPILTKHGLKFIDHHNNFVVFGDDNDLWRNVNEYLLVVFHISPEQHQIEIQKFLLEVIKWSSQKYETILKHIRELLTS